MRKKLPATELIRLLENLPSGSSVEANLVGNLLVTDESDTRIAYIDFNAGEVAMYDEELPATLYNKETFEDS